jgi:hypothetical protein
MRFPFMNIIRLSLLAFVACALAACQTMTPRSDTSSPMQQGGAGSPGMRTDPSPTNVVY